MLIHCLNTCKATPALGTFFEFAERSCPPATVVAEATMAHQMVGKLGADNTYEFAECLECQL